MNIVFFIYFLCRYKYSSRHFIIPVIFYSILYNIPKFFELKSICPNSHHDNKDITNVVQENSTEDNGVSCSYSELELVARDFRLGASLVMKVFTFFYRTSYWYLNIYVLWLNSILNILLPIISLVILNILILR